MNYIKYISLFCFLFVCIENNAQLSSVGKATAKTGIKAGLKSVAKSSIKEASQRAVFKEMKDVAVKKGVKSAIVDKLGNEMTSTLAEEISSKAFKETSENIAKKSVKISGNKIVKRQTQQLAKGSVSTSSKLFLKNKASNYIVGTVKGTSEIVESSIKKTIIDEGSSKVLSIEAINIQKAIGKKGYEQVELFLPNVASQRILLNDIQIHPQLAKYFRKNPTLIQNYSQCLSSKCRTDIGTLRYLNFHADSYADACMFSKTKYLRAKELQFVDYNSETFIKNSQTGETLGIIKGDIIKIPSDNHSLLNMRLMKNMKYHVDNSIFQTDKLGRPVYVKTNINPKFKGTKIYDRDKIAQGDFRKARTNASKLDSKKLNDDAGHIIAHDLGGVSDGINLLPQNASLNRGAYKKMENKIKKDVKKGYKAEIEIEIHYSGASERPEEYIYTYYKNNVLNSKEIYKNLIN